MKIGYARVSTGDQHLDLQRDALIDAGCEKIFEDTMSGSQISRSGLNAAIEFVRSGDTLVIWRLDRLGRSLQDLLSLVQNLNDRGIALQSLHEQLDTSSATGKLIYHVFGALSEFERNLIVERTRAGLKAARARGRHGGRPSKLSDAQIKEIRVLMQSPGISTKRIAEQYGISRSTIYNCLKQ